MEKQKILIEKSDKPQKKFRATVGNKHVYFGQAGFSDFTLHRNPERKNLHISRHKGMNENWGKSGIETAGFYAKNILWNKPTISESVRDTNKRFGLNIVFKK